MAWTGRWHLRIQRSAEIFRVIEIRHEWIWQLLRHHMNRKKRSTPCLTEADKGLPFSFQWHLLVCKYIPFVLDYRDFLPAMIIDSWIQCLANMNTDNSAVVMFESPRILGTSNGCTELCKAILGVGFPVHKPGIYSWYRLKRWGYLRFRYLKCFGDLGGSFHTQSKQVQAWIISQCGWLASPKQLRGDHECG